MNILEGEREAEDMIVEAYTAVLLAFLSLERYISSKDRLFLIMRSIARVPFFLSFLSINFSAFRLQV